MHIYKEYLLASKRSSCGLGVKAFAKGHWWCYREHPVIIAPVPHLNKSLARFIKTSSIRGFSQEWWL